MRPTRTVGVGQGALGCGGDAIDPHRAETIAQIVGTSTIVSQHVYGNRRVLGRRDGIVNRIRHRIDRDAHRARSAVTAQVRYRIRDRRDSSVEVRRRGKDDSRCLGRVQRDTRHHRLLSAGRIRVGQCSVRGIGQRIDRQAGQPIPRVVICNEIQGNGCILIRRDGVCDRVGRRVDDNGCH